MPDQATAQREFIASLREKEWEEDDIDQAQAGWEFVTDMGPGVVDDVDSIASDLAEAVIASNNIPRSKKDFIADNIHEGVMAAFRFSRTGEWRRVSLRQVREPGG